MEERSPRSDGGMKIIDVNEREEAQYYQNEQQNKEVYESMKPKYERPAEY